MEKVHEYVGLVMLEDLIPPYIAARNNGHDDRDHKSQGHDREKYLLFDAHYIAFRLFSSLLMFAFLEDKGKLKKHDREKGCLKSALNYRFKTDRTPEVSAFGGPVITSVSFFPSYFLIP